MTERPSGQELHHEIFGSVIDRDDMTPYLLLRAGEYRTSLAQATRMMGNRGFDTLGGDELSAGEKERANRYVEHTCRYCFNFLFPFVEGHLSKLVSLGSWNKGLYADCIDAVTEIKGLLNSSSFREIISEDPRHLFLMASSKKYPKVFYGYKDNDMKVPPEWQQAACSILKVAYLIKSIEEDSQDINDHAQLGMFLEMEGQSLNDLYNYDWHDPKHLPESEPAQRAFVKIGTFFLKLKESLTIKGEGGGTVFDSGDGVEVDIVSIESRLKSPESMFTKLGKSVEGEAHNIRDVLAITFIIKNMDDTLMLFHALQKRGVILQENTISQTVTQTLFNEPEDMVEAVRKLMAGLAKSEGTIFSIDDAELLEYAKSFYEALSMNAQKNPHTAIGHNKFQCKLNISIPIHRRADTNRIMIPGTSEYMNRNIIDKNTEQHTLALELRISDAESWRVSEQKGDSHHDAYKFRQLVTVMNRLFKGRFNLPKESFDSLREDQKMLYP